MNLLVVESPTKARKIATLLGSDWRILASVGHIRDLPGDDLGVALDTFKPRYVRIEGKEDVLSKLHAAVREVGIGNVYLGTDPDREGEAIAVHLEAELGLRDPKRVFFRDIERNALLKGVSSPTRIDRDLVAAQEARRVLDRLEGFGVTGALREKTGQPWTAGRTQSPGLRLVVEREEEIRAFVSITHCSVRLSFDTNGEPWSADWQFKSLLPDMADGEKAKYWTDRPFADRVAKLRDVRVVSCKEKDVSVSPAPAFTTSTLQQAGSASLRFNTSKTMALAQKLHEKGYISYHATDDPNLSPESAEIVRNYARKLRLPVAESARMVKVAASSQGGHKAICPTHIEVRDGRRESSDPLTEDEQKLYDLIWRRTVASQMADAVDAARMLTLESLEALNGMKILFAAEGRKEKFKGFRELAAVDATKDLSDTAEAANPVPALAGDTRLRADVGKVLDKKTKPPARYTTATLVKALESRGIGRPRTFSTIVETIMRRAYVEERKEGRTSYLFPTAEGEANMGLVRNRFAVADLGYTKLLEERFDQIAAGKAKYYDVVKQSYNQYLSDLRKFAAVDATQLGVATGGTCPTCKVGTLFRKPKKPKPGAPAGVKQFFWGCSRYKPGNAPDGCSGAFRDAGGAPDFTERAPLVEGDMCPQCKVARLVRRLSADKRAWWGCRGYPNCSARFPDVDGVPDFAAAAAISGGPCGVCKTGTLLLRLRKAGGQFWSCNGYGKKDQTHCEAIYDDVDGRPDTQRIACPKCSWGALRQLKGSKGIFWACGDRACKLTMPDVDGKPDPAAEAWEKGRSRTSSRKSPGSKSSSVAKPRRPRAASGA